MNRKTRRFAMILATVLAAAMLISLIASIYYNVAAGATTLDTLKSKKAEIAADKKRIAEKLAATKSEKKAKINQKYALDEQIDITEQLIENTTLLIQEYTIQIAETQQSYMDAVAAEKEMKEKFKLRLRAMEEMGEVSYISILMQSRSFSDLLGRVSIISEIAESDRKMIEELKAASDKISEAKQQLEVEKSEQLDSKRLLSDTQAELVDQYKELDSMLDELEADIAEYAIAQEEAEKAEKELNKEIDRIVAESKKKNPTYVGGTFKFPCPGYTRISSPYGSRNHPVLGVIKMHTGVDLAAPKGTPIYAANTGTVILAQYNGGYGNCVVIDHGGGVATLYGHCSQLLVKNGQSVTKGDKIALVGSTGVSTGPHLHFEIRRNGVTEDPMKHFTAS